MVLLAGLPWVVRRYFGPVRPGWAPRAARAGGYAMVLALIAAKAVKDRDGSKLGAYFVVVPGIWVMEILLLLVIAAYVAGLLILTSQRVRLTRWILPAGIGFGAVTAGVLYALAPFGVKVDPSGPSLKWWGLAALALPLATGFLAARLSARDTSPAALGPVRAGLPWPRAAPRRRLPCCWRYSPRSRSRCSRTTYRSRVPGGRRRPDAGYIAGAAARPATRTGTVIPPGLRHEYWVEISVGQAGQTPLAALLIAPFLGAWLGVLGGGLGGRLRAARAAPAARMPPHRMNRLSRLSARPLTPTSSRGPGHSSPRSRRGRLTKDRDAGYPAIDVSASVTSRSLPTSP